MKRLGSLQKLDNLFELVLGLVDPGDVGESDLMGIFGQQLGAALTEGHRLAATNLHLAHEENPDADQQQHREPLHEENHPPWIAIGGAGGDFDTLLAQNL